ncbi:bifunctional 4-alpha-glucanotransferase/amylo-alpha-1,6-glucosidase [Saitoella coloradoensis]
MAPAKPLIYTLALNDNGSPRIEGRFLRLPAPYEPYTLRFEIEGGSQVTRDGVFMCSYPEDEKKGFVRGQFREFPIAPDFNHTITIDIPIRLAGTFSYKIAYTPLPEWDPLSSSKQTNGSTRTETETFYFIVDPALKMSGEPLPLEAVALQSVIAKWMGPVHEWDARLKAIKEKGYNMIHFTPLQMRGESNSPYSIYQQLEFADDLFGGKKLSKEEKEKKLGDVLAKMERDGLMGLTDVVWNHTANNSAWLQEHPEAGYNLVTAPWLRPAYELDTALLEFGAGLKKYGLPTNLENTGDLLRVMEGVKTHVLGQIKLWEFYVVDVNATAEEAVKAYTAGKFADGKFEINGGSSLVEKAEAVRAKLSGTDHFGERFRKTLDGNVGAAFLRAVIGEGAGEDAARKEISSALDEVNLNFYKAYDADKEVILDQIYNRVKYVRLDEHGPKLGAINEANPLIESYFTRLPKNEVTSKHDEGSLALANNGWIWAANALEDFAGPRSSAYLRREVIVWGDCVKLRYGKGKEDNPWLWDHMAEYTQLMARHFHGFRIDNCHSTPLWVGAYMLDAARRVRPDLYVVAELFTGSEDMDVVFVQNLGISGLIREGMVAWGAGELSRLVHRHGGRPIGSLDQGCLKKEGKTSDGEDAVVIPLQSSGVGALFMDCTHDNETPAQKRTAADTLSTGALVAMSASSVGSVYGFDEVFPKLLDLVGEERLYEDAVPEVGIAKIKGVLNRLHVEMGREGYSETHVHHEGEYITIHRFQPATGKGYMLIAHTAFQDHQDRGEFNTITLTGTKVEGVLSAKLVVEGTEDQSDDQYLKGLKAHVEELEMPYLEEVEGATKITVPGHFPPGSIALLKTQIPGVPADLDEFLQDGVKDAVKGLDLIDLNVALYRADGEERDCINDGTYNIPGHGNLVYCGLEGWMAPLKQIISHNDLAHALCQHLREGQWPLDYVVGRLEKYHEMFPRLQSLADWLRSKFDAVRKLPSFLLPRYFAMVIHTAYVACRTKAISLFAPYIQEGSHFVQSLALCSVQMQGRVKTTSLHPSEPMASMAAGLPHFTNEWARCWGRDVFISIRGLFTATGRFEDAREHILAFATTLKHGMIPNLLDSIRKPRYNSRDSVWFFLQAIQDYTRMAPNGADILKEKVKRRFPLDDTWCEWDSPEAYSYESSIEEIIQEVMQRHASGLHFREANADTGTLDSQMKSEGFNIDVEVDWETGLIFGGNPSNCGTWMDKMGESTKSGTKGTPATPRDGAAIEISGMLKSALRWINDLRKKGLFKWDGVDATIDGKDTKVSFEEWEGKVQKSFERCYYVPENPEDDKNYDVNPEVVNRRGIYKDLYRSSREYEDYQLRPNFAIAMNVAPELFIPEHAARCLLLADNVLRPEGSVGMRTLDPSDYNFRPNYDQSQDSDDWHTAKGFSYHQGPAWGYPTGFFLRALLKFSLVDQKDTIQHIFYRLHPHREQIEKSPWAGIEELEQADGSYCASSCHTQAWSSGTLLDLFADVRELVEESSIAAN